MIPTFTGFLIRRHFYYCQWRRGGGARGQFSPPKFWAVGKLSENVLVVEKKFLSKNAKLGVVNIRFGEI